MLIASKRAHALSVFLQSVLLEGMMRMLLPIGVILVLLGTGGYAASCFSTSLFERPESETLAAQLDDPNDAAATEMRESGPPVILATLSGLVFAAGLVCLAIGMGRWKRADPSGTRSADPWSDRPGEHGERPRGLL
jgi:hypothetical protein